MSRKEEQARREGISYAIRFLERGGTLEELKEDAKKRGAYDIPVGLDPQAYDKFSKEVVHRAHYALRVLADATLRDKFGFGHDRLEKFNKGLISNAESLNGDFVTWEEMAIAISEETGIYYEDPNEVKA